MSTSGATTPRIATPRTTPARRGWLVAGGAAAAVGGATLLFPTPDPARPGFLAFTVCDVAAFVLLLAAVTVVVRLGVTGPSRLGRLGLGASAIALTGFALAEAATPGHPAVGEVVHPVTVPLLGLGMTLVGAAVLRARVWPGRTRFAPLVCGVLPLAVELPWFVVVGPDTWVIALTWCGWVLLGAALVATAVRGEPWNVPAPGRRPS